MINYLFAVFLLCETGSTCKRVDINDTFTYIYLCDEALQGTPDVVISIFNETTEDITYVKITSKCLKV